MVWNEVAHALAFNARHSLDTRRAVDPIVSSAIMRMISALRAASSDVILSTSVNQKFQLSLLTFKCLQAINQTSCSNFFNKHLFPRHKLRDDNIDLQGLIPT